VYVIKRKSQVGFDWQSAYKIDLVSQKQIQMEGIAFDKSGSCFVSNEKFSSSAKLQKLNFSIKPKTELVQIDNVTNVFPNPSCGQITITSQEMIKKVFIYTTLGQKLYEMNLNGFEHSIFFEKYLKGIYHLHILYEDGKHRYLIIVKN
jgi:hypothetical protein